jgi:ankyrin repeat protein
VAIEKGFDRLVKLLVEKRANPDSKDRYGRTPLSWAAEREHEAVMKLLVEKGADADSIVDVLDGILESLGLDTGDALIKKQKRLKTYLGLHFNS